MSLRSSRSSSSKSTARDISERLAQGVETALTEQCDRRHSANLLVSRGPASTDEAVTQLRIECRGLLRMAVQVEVVPAGGDVYDVRCTVEEGPSCRYSYAPPRDCGTVQSPRLSGNIASFLLEEVEKQLGRLLLNSPAGPPAKSSLRSALNRS